ncbi:hypothetical protein, partial [Frankia sp. AgW1.1]|uniref:hypothetical protein n=1 Tax=Frankia sp. AgW1.1 TaxID=1836971 RepID=UPI0019313D2F
RDPGRPAPGHRRSDGRPRAGRAGRGGAGAPAAGPPVALGSRAGGWTDITTTVEAEPTDALDRGWPVTSLLRPGAYWLEFATIQTRIRVTARWGWPAVPDDIVQAAQIQATRLFKRKDSPEGVAGSADWGVIRIGRTDPDVAALTGPYALAGFS